MHRQPWSNSKAVVVKKGNTAYATVIKLISYMVLPVLHDCMSVHVAADCSMELYMSFNHAQSCVAAELMEDAAVQAGSMGNKSRSSQTPRPSTPRPTRSTRNGVWDLLRTQSLPSDSQEWLGAFPTSKPTTAEYGTAAAEYAVKVGAFPCSDGFFALMWGMTSNGGFGGDPVSPSSVGLAGLIHPCSDVEYEVRRRFCDYLVSDVNQEVYSTLDSCADMLCFGETMCSYMLLLPHALCSWCATMYTGQG